MKYEYVPSLITLGNLVAGFVSLLFTMKGKFKEAATLIILSAVLDGMDGLVARRFKLESEFGKGLDTLADLVSFGIAPAALIYSMHFIQLEIIGLFIIIPYVICTALRLVRFNLQTPENTFHGLPTTIAGGFLASFVFCNLEFSIFFIATVVILLSYLMMSSIRYPRLEYMVSSILFHTLNYFKLFLILLIFVFILFLSPGKLILFPLLFYILHGIKKWILTKLNDLRRVNSSRRSERAAGG